jgi:putative FmdB family regulatory protein
MPIYEFECSVCGHTKEILMIKKSDWKGSHKLGCDKCKGMYHKIISAPSDPVVKGFNEKNGYSNVPPKGKKDGKTNKRRK